MTLSEKILKLRTEKGMSQEKLAEALGVSGKSVSGWEAGDFLPDSSNIISMSRIFGVTTDYLLIDDVETTDCGLLNGEAHNIPAFSIAAQKPVEAPYDGKDETNSKVKKPSHSDRKALKRFVAAVVAVCIIAAAIAVPVHFGGLKKAMLAVRGGKTEYPYVLVHGLGGWGESTGINSVVKYWGSTSGDIAAHLKQKGKTVYEPSVGPVSSNWDRVCELYAQLTGTRVDYGEAHSKYHHHERYGENFETPLVENWGKKVKINLIGHSFGGITARTLAYLLENGDEAERKASGKDVSPLFEGGKGNWVFSVTTLCAPHNGSSLTEAVNSVTEDIGSLGSLIGLGEIGKPDSTQILASLCFGLAGFSEPIKGTYDFKLGHFGLGKSEGGITGVTNTISTLLSLGKDHAGFDLSPDGAAQINSKIRTVKGVYYFSYAYCTTHEGTLVKGKQVPVGGTLPLLYVPALLIGRYAGTTKGGIVIDESWQPNDGLVSVVSAQYPSNEEYFDYDGDVKHIKTGIWNFMGTSDGDHGTVVGLNSTAEKTFGFYDNLTEMIDSLR